MVIWSTLCVNSSAMANQRVGHISTLMSLPPPAPTVEPPQPATDAAYDPLDDRKVQKGLKRMEEGFDCLSGFTTLEYKMHETIR